MATWGKEEENTFENWKRKKETEKADKVGVAPGVTVASLRRFRAALIGRTKDTPSSVSCADRKARKPRECGDFVDAMPLGANTT